MVSHTRNLLPNFLTEIKQTSFPLTMKTPTLRLLSSLPAALHFPFLFLSLSQNAVLPVKPVGLATPSQTRLPRRSGHPQLGSPAFRGEDSVPSRDAGGAAARCAKGCCRPVPGERPDSCCNGDSPLLLPGPCLHRASLCSTALRNVSPTGPERPTRWHLRGRALNSVLRGTLLGPGHTPPFPRVRGTLLGPGHTPPFARASAVPPTSAWRETEGSDSVAAGLWRARLTASGGDAQAGPGTERVPERQESLPVHPTRPACTACRTPTPRGSACHHSCQRQGCGTVSIGPHCPEQGRSVPCSWLTPPGRSEGLSSLRWKLLSRGPCVCVPHLSESFCPPCTAHSQGTVHRLRPGVGSGESRRVHRASVLGFQTGCLH